MVMAQLRNDGLHTLVLHVHREQISTGALLWGPDLPVSPGADRE